MNEPLLLTVTEVAEKLHLSRGKTYQLIDSGELRSLHIGRVRRIPRGAVAEFIAQRLAAGVQQ